MIQVDYGVDYYKYLNLLMIKVFQMIKVDFRVDFIKYINMLMI
jgi:hypothetical protein